MEVKMAVWALMVDSCNLFKDVKYVLKFQKTFSHAVRDLDLTLDQELSLSQHVNLVSRSCYYQLRQL